MAKDNNDTRELIRRTIIDLMEEMPYEKISVIDIAKKTNVSRQTFYVHFSSKEELALSFLDDIFYDFFDIVEPESDRNSNQFIFETLYEIHKNNERNWNVVMSCNISAAVNDRYSSYVRRFLGNIIRKIDAKFDSTFYVDSIIAHLAGSSLNLMQLWMEKDMPVSAAEMAKINLLLLHRNLPSLIRDMKGLSDNYSKNNQ